MLYVLKLNGIDLISGYDSVTYYSPVIAATAALFQ